MTFHLINLAFDWLRALSFSSSLSHCLRDHLPVRLILQSG